MATVEANMELLLMSSLQKAEEKRCCYGFLVRLNGSACTKQFESMMCSAACAFFKCRCHRRYEYQWIFTLQHQALAAAGITLASTTLQLKPFRMATSSFQSLHDFPSNTIRAR
jgi:hypothetical protein